MCRPLKYKSFIYIFPCFPRHSSPPHIAECLAYFVNNCLKFLRYHSPLHLHLSKHSVYSISMTQRILSLEKGVGGKENEGEEKKIGRGKYSTGGNLELERNCIG